MMLTLVTDLKDITKEEMMELFMLLQLSKVASLVHGVQMMNKYNKLSM
jgi:hypothetical protein